MSDDEKPKIFQLGTVPPPAGEHDAYSAPTKVGPMAAQIQELINAATEEAERKQAQVATAAQPTTAPPPLAATTAPPPLAAVEPEEEDDDDPIPDGAAFDDETRMAEGAYALLADIAPAPRAAAPRPSVRSTPLPSPAPSPSSKPPPPPSKPAPAEEPELELEVEPAPSARPAAREPFEPPSAALEAAIAALPVGPAPIVITEPLPAFDDVKLDAPLALDSGPSAAYSDPIAHTRPEWSSVSKSEPKLPVAKPVRNLTPLLIGLLVIVFGLAGVAFLIFGHR